MVTLTLEGTLNYTYGLQRISEAQSISGAWTPSLYGYDGFGSVRQLTNLSATVTDTYNYDAFGNLLSSTGTTPNNYLYRGEQYDSDLGLYYLRARYYNPQTGRFMSRDPEDGNVKDPATLHKYLYAGGDPVNAIDPRGRSMTEEAILLLRVGSAVVAIASCSIFLNELYEAIGPNFLDNPKFPSAYQWRNLFGLEGVCLGSVAVFASTL